MIAICKVCYAYDDKEMKETVIFEDVDTFAKAGVRLDDLYGLDLLRADIEIFDCSIVIRDPELAAQVRDHLMGGVY